MPISHAHQPKSTRNLSNGAKPSTLERHAFKGQTQTILRMLEERRYLPNPWVQSHELAQVGLQYQARLFTIREAGYHVESRIETHEGRRHGFYRLVATPEERQSAQAKLPLGAQ